MKINGGSTFDYIEFMETNFVEFMSIHNKKGGNEGVSAATDEL